MHIVLYKKIFRPEYEYLETALIREFLTKGHKVTVISSTIKKVINESGILHRIDNHQIRETERNGVKIIRLKTKNFGKRKGASIVYGLMKQIFICKPDLVIVFTIENYFDSFKIAMIRLIEHYRLFIIVNDHSNFNKTKYYSNSYKILIDKNISNYLKLKELMIRGLKKVSLMISDKIITTNEFTEIVADDILRKSRNKRIRITLGVDHKEVFFDEKIRGIIRKNLGYNENDVVIIHSGKMLPHKKTHILVRAFGELKTKNAKLLLIGNISNSYLKEINEIIKLYDLSKIVKILPAVESGDLKNYFCAADVAVWVDHATISTIVASAVGLPIIVPNFFGYEHRTKYNNGLRIIPGSKDDLKEKLKNILEDSNIRNEMGRKGRELVENELNWEHIASKILVNYIPSNSV